MTDWRDDRRWRRVPCVAAFRTDPATSWIKGVEFLLASHRRLGGRLDEMDLDRALGKKEPPARLTHAPAERGKRQEQDNTGKGVLSR